MNDNVELDLKTSDTNDFTLKSFYLNCISPALKFILSTVAIVFLAGLLVENWGEITDLLIVDEGSFYVVFVISVVSIFSALITFCACITYKISPKSIMALTFVAAIILFLLSLVSVRLSFSFFGLTGFKLVCYMAMHLPIALISIILIFK